MRRYTIEQLKKYTTLSKRQINNKLKELKLLYPNDILGGGNKGKKSKYFINHNILELVTERIYKSDDKEYKLRRENLFKKIEEDKIKSIYDETTWDYFCGLTPIKLIEPQQLIELIKHPKIKIFYTIHTKTEDLKNHIHFLVKILDNTFNLEKHLNSIRVKKIHDFRPFENSLKEECYNYMMIKGKHNNRIDQFRIDYGII